MSADRTGQLDLGGTAGALPRPLGSFVGRDHELRALTAHVDEHPLVTLVGTAGAGKTRLAIELSNRRQRTSGRDVRFVDLASVESAALVVHAVAAAVGVPEAGSAPLGETLARSLVGRELLVVLDNCEHLVEECAALALSLLQRCNGVSVLATSREPLGVTGELTWPVRPMPLPSADSDDPLAELLDADAGRLFVERARLARPGYEPTPLDADAVVDICRRLDGIPLALELTAARMRSCDAHQLRGDLERSASLLTGPRTAPARQQTMDASIGWSHELLGELDRRLFRRLSVFAGSFTAETCAAVCSDAGADRDDGLDRDQLLVRLIGLAERSLVQIDERPDGIRYRLLETIRRYARRQLVATGDEGATRDRHLAHFAAVAARFAALEDGDGIRSAADSLERDIDDLRAAVEHAVTCGDVRTGLRLITDLRLLWVTRSRAVEGHNRLTTLLGLVDDGDPPDDPLRAEALTAAAQLALYACDPLTQHQLAGEALAAARAAKDRRTEARALALRGWAEAFFDPDAARAPLSEGLDLARRHGDNASEEFALFGLGIAAVNTGDLAAARTAFAQGIEISRAHGTFGVRFGLGGRGYVATLSGELDEARHLLDEALALPGDGFDRFNRDLATAWRALVSTYEGDYPTAQRLLEDALASARVMANPEVFAHLHLGLLGVAVGDANGATAHLVEALPLLQVMRLRWYEVQALRWLGDAAAIDGDGDTAAQRWHEAMTVAETSRNPLAQSVAAVGLARSATSSGDLDRARTLRREALRHAVTSGYAIGVVDALDALVACSRAPHSPDKPDGDDTVVLLAVVERERKRIGYRRFPTEQATVDGLRERLQAALGDGFAEAWDRGSRLSLHDAVTLASRGARPPRPPSGWAALTPAELRVARLVVDGLTNPQIGERLFVSRRTVQAQLSSVYSKLGITGRAELAALVSHHDPPDATE